MINMDKLICEALKLKRNKNGDAIILHGCGMSLKYATLYDYYRKKGITDYDRLAANANTL
jgi:hypothetical protein